MSECTGSNALDGAKKKVDLKHLRRILQTERMDDEMVEIL